ncbi:MAG: DUF1003 domain-containing protein [Rhabdaerophilum sp.]
MTDVPLSAIDPEADRASQIEALRKLRPALLRVPPPMFGERVADKVAALVGSWRFIIIQSVILALWILANIVAYWQHWDPYPFILLNLVLSFQAAYTAPIIMMSQNRQAQIDRKEAENDYRVNVKAELEIELLHEKIDALREQEILRLITTIEHLSARLERSGK